MFIENFVIILILKLADKNIHNLDCYSEEEYSKYWLSSLRNPQFSGVTKDLPKI